MVLLVAVAVVLIVVAKSVSGLRSEVKSLRAEVKGFGAEVKSLRAELDSRPEPVIVAAPSPAPAPAAPVAPPAPVSDGIPADVFAAIVSAIHYTMGDGHQIISLSQADSLAWSREGRRGIFGSHQIR